MKPVTLARKLLLALAGLIALAHPLRALAEDIDIFVAGAGGSSVANVLIVIDNTTNWANARNLWPGGLYQGQAELKAIKTVVKTLNDKVNVGVMMGNNNGGGPCCAAGYIRYAMRPMNPANQESLAKVLDDIYNDITAPVNQAASSAEYSSPLFDAYKYFGGYTSPALALKDQPGPNPPGIANEGFGTPVFASPHTVGSIGYSLVADPVAYTPGWEKYIPPDVASGECSGQNFIIFVGNTWPNADTAPQQNLKAILEAVGGDSAQIPLPMLTTTTTVESTVIGPSACYANTKTGLDACNAAAGANPATVCGSQYDTCTCAAPTTAAGCTGANVHYTLTGGITTTTVDSTGQTCAPGAKDCSPVRHSDEWTRFLYQTDVNEAKGQQNVITYTIDVFRAKQNADQTALLYSMASAGGGKYFAATNEADLEGALSSIFAEIQAVNSTFASASLPVSATNRALNVNEVYMGIFRPDSRALPRWYGNLKRYKIKDFGFGDLKLADVNGLDAVNTLNGFITDCATSWWTSDSGRYWKNVSIDPSPAGLCPSPGGTPFDPFSDAPDGPKVEKGGVAEILRQGNVAPGAPTWTLNRTLYTKGFVAYDTGSSGMSSADADFVSGLDVDANGNAVTYAFTNPAGTQVTTRIRNTIHGGVVHSRPLPINYGAGATVLYYGSDDGTYRAVDSTSGRELWAYIPEEFYPTLPRLRQNSPIIKYSFMVDPEVDPAPEPKNYHFDGSTGAWQTADNSAIWIYPTMRRGGRMIYAFDVTNRAAPSLLWKNGCADLTVDTNCTSGFSGIGQTWSTPNVAPLSDGGTVKPMLVVGGGYDNCEDGAPNNACPGAKGAKIYILDAKTGEIVREFDTNGRVPSDVSLIDIDNDQIPDYGYVGDTRGYLYRLTFGLSKSAPLAAGSWTITTIAATTNTRRKFLHAPALVHGYDKGADKNYVYVALGTGDREQPLETQYPYRESVQNRFYVFMDDVTLTTTADLEDTSSTMNNATADPGCGNQLLLPGIGRQGWFMDLPNRGEQTVTSAIIVGGLVAFSTNNAKPAGENTCAPLGEARGYVLNLFNASGGIGNEDACGGQRSGMFAEGGLPPSPVIANVEVDGKVQTIVIGVADLKGRPPSSPIQSEIGFTLKPQKRIRTYWRQEGNN
jgi:type IV pilus assembly protein PilY1